MKAMVIKTVEMMQTRVDCRICYLSESLLQPWTLDSVQHCGGSLTAPSFCHAECVSPAAVLRIHKSSRASLGIAALAIKTVM